MFSKRLGIAVLLSGLFVLPLSASMVSFLVIEEGLQPGAEAGDYSALWEDSLMGTFFDAGHIVSNSPILRVEKLSAAVLPLEVQADYADAFRGGADFFIIAVLEYRTQDRRTRPFTVSIKIFTTNSEQLIYENRFPAGNGINSQDEYLKAQETARIIAAQIGNM